MSLKQKILELKTQGKSYNEIVSVLNCSKSTVCYHLGPFQKERNLNRNRRYRSKLHPLVRKWENFIACKSNNNKPKISELTVYTRIYKKLQHFFTNAGTSPMPETNIKKLINDLENNPYCYLTGDKIDIYDTKSYEFDHKIPISRGGSNSIENLGLCTKQINRAKSDLTPEEFIELCEKVINHHKTL